MGQSAEQSAVVCETHTDVEKKKNISVRKKYSTTKNWAGLIPMQSLLLKIQSKLTENCT